MDEHLRGRAFLLVAVTLLAFTSWGWWREHDASKAAERVALAHRLALHAAELRESDADTALKLGLAAVEIHSDDLTRTGLTNTALAGDRESLDLDGADQVALSGDGRVALAVGYDAAQVVRLGSGRARTLGKREGLVRVSALSSDGRTALVGEDGGATTVWDLDDPARPVRGATLKGEATALALSRDGRTAAMGEARGTMAVWDLTDRAHPVRRSVTEILGGETEDVALSADGRTAVTSKSEGPVTVWNLADPAKPARTADLPPSIHTATALGLSADGRTLVVARRDPGADWKVQVAVWTLDDPARPAAAAIVGSFANEIEDVALSSDGVTALLVENGGGASLWDLSTPSRPVRRASLPGPWADSSYPASAALTADAGTALTAGAGGSSVSRWALGDLRGFAADKVRRLCEGGWGSMSRADWDHYTGGARPSDHGGYDSPETVSLCDLGLR